jgi:hypothetical protein
MNRVVIAAGFLAVSLACSAGHAVTVTDVAAFSRIADRFLLTVEVGTPGQADYRFIYSDRMGHVHVYAMDGDVLKMTWEVTTLGSRATAVIVSDLYGDGKLKLLISSSAGRVLIYDLATYELDWENQQLRYNRIDHMATAQLDGDRQLEVVVLADDRLYIFDGYNRNVQWSSTTNMIANYVVVGTTTRRWRSCSTAGSSWTAVSSTSSSRPTRFSATGWRWPISPGTGTRK